MQAEINLLKEREMHLIACMQKDRDEIVEEKQHLEQVMSLPSLKIIRIFNIIFETIFQLIKVVIDKMNNKVLFYYNVVTLGQ